MKSMMLVMLLLLTGCVSHGKNIQLENPAPAAFPTLTAIGYAPLATQPSKEPSHRILMAMQASKIAAYRELAEQVYGQQISASSNVSEWLLTDDKVKSSVSGIIRGAKVVKTYPAGEFYVTELELDFKQVWQLYAQQNRPTHLKNITYF
jgi:hypothetical protein